jgi:transposase, IS5 family
MISMLSITFGKLRDRSRSVGLRLLEIARAARGKAPPSQAKMKLAYGRLLNATGRVVGQAKRFSKEITTGVKHSLVPARHVFLEGHQATRAVRNNKDIGTPAANSRDHR